LKDGRVIHIKTNYICKIIDYGRNYFTKGFIYPKFFENKRDKIQKILCNSIECQPNCGSNSGYFNFYDKYDDFGKDTFHINNLHRNISHDLRFADIIRKTSGKYDDSRINSISSKLKSILNNIKYDEKYGTEEVLVCDYDDIYEEYEICTVIALEKKLKDLWFEYEDYIMYKTNNYHNEREKMGDLQIYLGLQQKDMIYTV
jgi:hypothetical protein